MKPGDSDELFKQLLATFALEAVEHVQALSAGLIELEGPCPARKEIEVVEKIFREAHSLKGAARAVNAGEVEAACQSLENTFARLKAGTLTVSKELIDQLHDSVDAIRRLLGQGSDGDSIHSDTNGVSAADGAQQNEGKNKYQSQQSVPEPARKNDAAIGDGAAHIGINQQTAQIPARAETLRVPVERVDSLLRQAEELLPAKAAGQERLAELREISSAMAAWKVQMRRSGTTGRAGKQTNEAPLQIEVEGRAVAGFAEKITALAKRLERDHHALERKVDALVEDAKSISMLPFSSLLDHFPKLVRDLCRDCGKEAELIVSGGEMEVDRRILEEIKDPLVHLVRNCVDHGVEFPSQRREQGKPPKASLHISVVPRMAGKLEITVTDDGAGIDLQKVSAAALRAGMLTEQEARQMDERQASALIFQSGLSTSASASMVSGRGLGLAIVREKVEKLGGTVQAKSKVGSGTSFHLVVPQTIARMRGVFVRVGDQRFVLPVRHVERVLRVPRAEIRSAENRSTFRYQEAVLAAIGLGEALGITTPGGPTQKHVPTVIARTNTSQAAFFVDEILGEHELLMKPLGGQVAHIRNIAGATVLGTGKVLPVLDMPELIQSAFTAKRPKPLIAEEQKPKSILVAEDSITSRTLVKGILELGGYRVKTAVDGADAWQLLGQEMFDLVVSDVEMPRMSGFDLTTKIRRDARTAQLPVVLVTGLASKDDRERGVDAGANAYVVKSNFEEGNLLEVVRRLI